MKVGRTTEDPRECLLFVRMTERRKEALQDEADVRHRDLSSLVRLLVFDIMVKGKYEKPIHDPGIAASEVTGTNVQIRMTEPEMKAIRRVGRKRSRSNGNLVLALIFGIDKERIPEPIGMQRRRGAEEVEDVIPEPSRVRTLME